MTNPVVLKPGKRRTATIQLDDIAWHVPAGHRLRLSLSTTYWPLMWPSPEPVTLVVDRAATLLNIPVREAPEDDRPPALPEAVAAPPLQLEEIRPEDHSRTTSTDDAGRLITEIVDDFGKFRDKTHGLITGSVGRERYSIAADDPLSAFASAHWTEELEREGWNVRTETFSEMTSDQTHFHLKARLEAYEDDVLIYEKAWSEKVPRDLN